MNDDEQLFVERLKSGDEAAWRSLYRRHYAFLCNVADGYVRDNLTAEGIVNDVCFNLYKKCDNLVAGMSLRAYLFIAVRNRCLNWIRRNKRRGSLDVMLIGGAKSGNNLYEDTAEGFSYEPMSRIIEGELEDEIMRAVSRLPEECRRVFCKSRFENKTYNEIAAELGISINTVRYHIKNALAQLHNDLDKYLLAILVFLSL